MSDSFDQRVSNKFAWAAFLCSILVVFIHVGAPNRSGTLLWWAYQFVTEGLCRCAVPFFFMTAGFFLARRYGQVNWYRKAIRSRLQTLLVPFLLWNGITLILTRAWSLPGILSGMGLNPVEYPALNPLWFMRSLMLFVLFSPILFGILKFLGGGGISMIVLLWWIGCCEKGCWDMPLRITFSIEGLTFFSIGALLSWYDGNWIGRFAFFNKRMLLFGFLVLSCSRVLMLELSGLHISCMRILVVLGGLCVLLCLSPDCPMPNCLTSCAFPIYILHGVVFGVARSIGMQMQLNSCCEYLARGCACAAVCIIVAQMGRRISPKVCKFIFGGR